MADDCNLTEWITTGGAAELAGYDVAQFVV
jgi:hypothetical protein